MTASTLSSVDLLERLVGFDTTSRNSNLALIDFVADYLDGHGVACQRVFDDGGAKANLFATIGEARDGGVVLSGHTDVVPVDGQDWQTDPFSLVRKDDRLHGRGSADMKGFIAVALAAVPELVRQPLAVPVHLAFSYDEEVGCLGAPRLVRLLAAAPFTPEAVIVGEPTSMRVVNRHKSIHRLHTTVRGRAAHSAHTDRGVSAIFFAGEVIHFLNELAAKLRAAPSDDTAFDPPYHTVHVGTIAGGTANNIIPEYCRFVWEARLLPDGDIERDVLAPLNGFVTEKLLPEMHAVDAAAGIDIERLVSVPGLAATPDCRAEALVRLLTGDNQPAGAVSFGTEGGLFQAGGTATAICGPGSILQAHGADEYIDLEQIVACEQFMQRLVDWARRGSG